MFSVPVVFETSELTPIATEFIAETTPPIAIVLLLSTWVDELTEEKIHFQFGLLYT